MSTEMHISDHYVTLLERVIDENRKLREAVKDKESSQQKILEDLSSKLNERGEEDDREKTRPSRRRSRTKVTVPSLCRVSIALLSMFKGNLSRSRLRTDFWN